MNSIFSRLLHHWGPNTGTAGVPPAMSAANNLLVPVRFTGTAAYRLTSLRCYTLWRSRHNVVILLGVCGGAVVRAYALSAGETPAVPVIPSQ
jgi:hypothetical protein